MGNLGGSDNTWNYTSIALDSALFDDIADGLMVMIDIDKDQLGYKVTLGKSLLTVNGVDSPDPDPDPRSFEPTRDTALP